MIFTVLGLPHFLFKKTKKYCFFSKLQIAPDARPV